MAYTNQSAFDLVCAHIFNQGEQAKNETFGCAYLSKTDPTKRCAVGALLTAEECKHLDLREDGDINTILGDMLEEGHDTEIDNTIWEKFAPLAPGLLGLLQVVHDKEDNWLYTKDMRDALRSVGYEHQLDVSCLEGMHFGDR